MSSNYSSKYDRWSAVYGLALVISDEEVSEVFKKMAESTDEFSFNQTYNRFEDEESLMTHWEVFDEYIRDNLLNGDLADMAIFVDGSEGEGQFFFSLGSGYSSFPDESLVFWANKEPDPFKVVYPGGLDEIIEEFKERGIAKWIPEDFNWGEHIGYYSFARCY